MTTATIQFIALAACVSAIGLATGDTSAFGQSSVVQWFTLYALLQIRDNVKPSTYFRVDFDGKPWKGDAQ